MKAFKDAFTDPNGYWCPVKVAGLVITIAGIFGYFLGKDPTFMILTGFGAMGGGKLLDSTVKPETPEQAAK